MFVAVGYLFESQLVVWIIRGTAGILAVLGWLIRLGYGYEWTGFGETEIPKPEAGEIRPKKTVWDWMDLLIVPFVLALGTIVFALYQENRQTQIEEQRAQNVALQDYLDQMSSLLLDKDRPLRQSKEGSEEARTLARAWTLTVLTRLEGQPGTMSSLRKGSVLQFLYEARLIGHVIDQKSNQVKRIPAVISLAGADLSGAVMPGRSDKVDLRGVDLHDTVLNGAILEGADLCSADLSGAILAETNLRYTNLSDADLSGAILFKAKLEGAYLRGIDLSDAELDDADLSNAYIEANVKRNCDGSFRKATTFEAMTTAEVERLGNKATDLEGAIMPDETKHP